MTDLRIHNQSTRKLLTHVDSPGIFAHLLTGALYLGCFATPLSAAGTSISISLIALASVANIKTIYRVNSKEPTFWLLIALISYILISQLFPRSPSPGPWNDSTIHIIRSSFIFLTGYWFWTRKRHLRFFLLAYSLGFLVRSVTRFPWNRALHALSGSTPLTLGLDHIQCGEIAGIAGIILLLDFSTWKHERNSTMSLALSIISALSGVWCFYILIISDSRSAWVATISSLIGIAATIGPKSFSLKKTGKTHIAIISIAFSIVGIAIYSNYPNIASRVNPVEKTLIRYYRGGVNEVKPGSSPGMRVHLFSLGAKKWLEKPIFGWGPSSSENVIFGSSIYKNVRKKARSNSFLNTPIQILVEFGIVGFLIFAAIITMLARGAIRLVTRSSNHKSASVIVLTILAYRVIFSLFDVTYMYMIDNALVLLFGGIAYALCLESSREAPCTSR